MKNIIDDTNTLFWAFAGSLFGLALLAACTTTQMAASSASQQGRLFCAVHTVSGPLVVALVDASASAANPAAGAAAVVATGMAHDLVDAYCAAAGGVAVSPPPAPDAAPIMAVVLPK